MGRNVGVLWTSLYVIGFFAVGSMAGKKWQKDPLEKEKSISCHSCNSAFDPRCGDPFDPYTIGFVNCSMRPIPEHLLHLKYKPAICRKTVQKIQGRTRIIRGCGYITDERDDKECVKRSGTHEVQVLYCSCTKSLCNTGHNEIRPSLRIIIFLILARCVLFAKQP